MDKILTWKKYYSEIIIMEIQTFAGDINALRTEERSLFTGGPVAYAEFVDGGVLP